MFGDLQVMPTMAVNVMSSSSTVQNPSFNFMDNMAFNPFPPLVPKEETGPESGSGSDQAEDKSGNEQQISDTTPAAKKKRYHRHTARQIQEMEALFKECPHPDDKQRQRLSQELGLKPRQVKFWFQNRRTQMKAQQDRSDNAILRAENENLKHDNYRLQAMLGNVACPNCGGPAVIDASFAFDEQNLRIQNARLKDELQRVCAFASQYNDNQIQAIPPSSLDLDMNMYSTHFSEQMVPLENAPVIMECEKSLMLQIATSSMEELLKMCRTNEALWSKTNGKDVLNFEEYAKMFGGELTCELRREITRDSGVVIMNSVSLVDAFFDADKWMELFPSIVSRAKTLQIISSDFSSPTNNSSLHLMYAEFQVLSPLVPTRETHFLRYCQHNMEEGIWAIVDFPIDNFHSSLHPSFPIYKRKPSGCIFQDMPNGYLNVTWIEHAQVEEKPVHQVFTNYVHSGMAFGAQRWLSVLKRQCERAASFMARNVSDLGVIPSLDARKNVMKLAQRMVRVFCINISTAGGQSWTALSDSTCETVRITTRKMTEPGQPNGVILGAVSTTWLPYSHNVVFDLLRDERCRSQLDVLSNGNTLQEIAHIAIASHPGTSISLLRINASNSSQNVELLLQESFTDNSGSLVVYSTIDVDSIQLAMNGQDPSSIPLLPLGFSIVPNNNNLQDNTVEGCLLTVGLQALASTVPSAKINLSAVNAMNEHICNAVSQIGAALSNNNGGGVGSCSGIADI